jgi:hypothetical protein
MAIVKFSRSEGHPQIEIKAIGSAEEAFLQEFIDTNRDNRWPPKLHYDVDGDRGIRFNWISRIRLHGKWVQGKYKPLYEVIPYLNFALYILEADIILSIMKLCELWHFKYRKLADYCAFTHYENSYYTAAIFLCEDTRYAYVLRQNTDTGKIFEFSYHDNMTMHKLQEIEKRIGV